MTRPLVSLCVPTWNRAESLRQSLVTIQGQDYEPLEILISDNDSTDDTEAFCRRLAAEDPRIRYFRQPTNIGLYGNHNFLLDQSRGEFVGFCHDHDTRSTDMVSKYVSFMFAHPEVGVVGSDWNLLDNRGQRVGVRDHSVREVTPGIEFIEHTMRVGRSSIGLPGALIRRSVLSDIRFPTDGPLGFGDFVLWFRIAERSSIGHMTERLWSWTQDPKGQSVRRIFSLIHDYDIHMNTYCDEYLRRAPDQAQRVQRWRRLIQRYIFWALVFEIGLHLRSDNNAKAEDPTLFEILPYRLSKQEFEEALNSLSKYRTGADQIFALFALRSMLRLRCTRPLAWVTRHYTSMRLLLGLR